MLYAYISLTGQTEEYEHGNDARDSQDRGIRRRVSVTVTYDLGIDGDRQCLGVDPVDADNRMAAEALYRPGYHWPIIDNSYLCKLIDFPAGLGLFDA